MSENMQVEYLWSKILARAEADISPKLSYSTFIKPLKPISLSNRKIILQAPWEPIADAFTAQGPDSLTARLRSAIVKADVGITDFAISLGDKIVFNADEEGVNKNEFDAMPLNKHFTFESFVVGPSNKLVYAAAKAVAQNPSQEGYNPLYIYGSTGLGKTHLVQAIANDILSRRPSFRVLYTTLEKFLNEFTRSLAPAAGSKTPSSEKKNRFRAYYRNADMLIIDDIQFLAGKPALQEEFFHTFNDLYVQNKQIILTSDENPDKISTLEDRLRTRFRGGLIWEIQPPDEHTKIEILRRKAMEKQTTLSDEVLRFLAEDSGSDVRTLEGRINKVILASKLYEQDISLELAALALNRSVRETESGNDLTAENVLNCVCEFYKIKKEDLLGSNRRAELVKARQICCYLMYDILNLPLVTIGKQLNRDHATVIYSKNKIGDLIGKNPSIAKDVNDIKSIILKN